MLLRTLILLFAIAATFPAAAGTTGAADTQSAHPRETLEFKLPGHDIDVVGHEHVIRTRVKDTFADIAQHYAIGYRELQVANPGVDPWLPGSHTLVVLPQRFILPDAPHHGIVLNTAEMRLYFYPASQPDKVMTFPVSVGRGEWQTPVTTTRVIAKIPHPTWYPPASVRMEYKKDGRQLPPKILPGPDNPLGDFALALGIHGYFIHGTNHPFAIGMQVTHGCIRLHPHDISLLFHDVGRKTPVTIVYQPYKAGWKNGVLYLEAHPPLDAAGKAPELSKMVAAVIHATGNASDYWVNWNYARQIARHPDGLLHAIGKRLPSRGEAISQR